MTTDMTQAYDWRGRTAVDRDGDKIGKLEEIYLDQESGEPEWALVSTGLFGMRSTFVPLAGASPSGERVSLNWDKSTIKDAPSIEPDGDLSHEEEAQLYDHYGLAYGSSRSDTGHDTSGPTTDDAMTRSEEELAVAKTRQERGRVRLKKYVVTEQVQTTVPVEREVARVEREPITDGNVDQALDGPAISDEEHEMTLSEERPVVEKRVVPKERVRLKKDVVTEERSASDRLRKEQIDADGEVER